MTFMTVCTNVTASMQNIITKKNKKHSSLKIEMSMQTV